MTVLKKVYDTVGRLSEWSGRIVSVAIPALVIVITFDVFMRYVFNNPTNWAYELSYMLGTATISLGLPYVHYHSSHVRVDVVYSRLSPMARLVLDIVLTVLLFFPLVFMWTKVFGANAWQSFLTHETSYDSLWYPLLWPFKTIIVLGFFLLLLQGAATFMRDVARLLKGGREPW
ncbi:MAG: TRAP transporter small permease subunit [Dehalococcoidia bacterium]|jgi:TRAP-type mannitol/chloroaromatic compound transport system permease small subunit|nr:TRAP transporter small permease subunit [Dehalococcoidia bacterium]